MSKDNSSGLTAIAVTLLGLMYVPWLLNFFQKIFFFPNVDGRYFLLYFILLTKFSDMGAYVVGSLIGRHKMIPRISPGKTWEGFAGAIVVSTACSVGFSLIAKEHLAGMNILHAVILGVILSVSKRMKQKLVFQQPEGSTWSALISPELRSCRLLRRLELRKQAPAGDHRD